jgi:NAD(P)-dependent dehydrogenase (short-subunit alcohol dehydrogenase family)
VDSEADVMAFINSELAPALCVAGPATPDHLLTTKRMPRYLPHPLEKLPKDSGSNGGNHSVELKQIAGIIGEAVEGYVRRYLDYVKRFCGQDPPAVLDPYPRIILIPGLGLVTTGKDVQAAGIANDLYRHTVAVMRGAQTVDRFVSIAEKDIYEVEYWPMELYKLTLAPAEKEFSRRVVLVTGGASGIGKVVARRFAEEGAHVAVTDLDETGAQAAAAEINKTTKSARAIGVKLDVTDERSVQAAFRAAVIAFGGVDIVFSNAGMAHSSPVEHMALKDWESSFKVNSTGHFLVAREAVRVLRAQGMGGSLIFNASKNVLAPGKDFSAYSASKAAETQLAKILAIENGAIGIRVNHVNPDAVFTDSKLWSPEVRVERAKAQGIKTEDLEKFYQSRNLLKTNVEPEDVAEAVLFLASKRSAKTTGATLPVDGGLRDAFPR